MSYHKETVKRRLSPAPKNTSKGKPTTTFSLAKEIELSTTAQGNLSQDSIVYLQRTIGNQAVQRLTATLAAQNTLIQRDLKFTNTQWHDAKNFKNARSGVNPVIIVDNLVVKGLPSGGAQQEFASQVYGDLVAAPKTRAVQLDSSEGKAIVFQMERKGMPKLNNEVTVLLVMEKVELRSMEDFVKETGDSKNAEESSMNKLRKGKKEKKNPSSFDSVIDKIFESNFFDDLGRIHAVDMFLGNPDRLDRYGEVAMQNIFVNVGNGSYGSLGLDLDVEAASLALVKSKGASTGTAKQGNKKNFKAIDANEYKDWVLHAIKGADATRTLENATDPTDTLNQRFGTMNAPGALDSPDISGLFDTAKIALAVNEFRRNLEQWFPKPPAQVTNERERRGDILGTPFYANVLWPEAHRKFAQGIQTGLATILEGMKPGGKYANLYESSIATNPKEDVFDFAVLKIRARYMHMKQDTVHNYTDLQIMTDLEAFAKRLMLGGIQRRG
ncbi:MAG: hypothetical protein H0X30_22380 [Anaerolineae bacterium]|nr:hypothetical protein [Anaerolineae bacterium]